MGYFSNGTEGLEYQDLYCTKCIHDGDCAVWDMHQLYNYDQKDLDKKAMLEILIPRRADGFNGKCRMFITNEDKAIDDFLKDAIDAI